MECVFSVRVVVDDAFMLGFCKKSVLRGGKGSVLKSDKGFV